jgi:hypothetical protein
LEVVWLVGWSFGLCVTDFGPDDFFSWSYTGVYEMVVSLLSERYSG